MNKTQKTLIGLVVVLTAFASGILTNTQLPSLSGLANLSEIDNTNAQSILDDPLDGTMQITASDLNAKFKAMQVLLSEASSSGGGSSSTGPFDYSVCSGYSVENTIDGTPITEYMTVPPELSSIFELTECAQMGCLVDSLRGSCVATTNDCKGAFSETQFLISDNGGGFGLCPLIDNDGGNMYFGPSCEDFTTGISCEISDQLGRDTAFSSGICGWSNNNLCLDLDFSDTDYCDSFSGLEAECLESYNQNGICGYGPSTGTCYSVQGSNSNTFDYCLEFTDENECTSEVHRICFWDGSECQG